MINYRYAFNWINSDSSAELLGGKILAEEGSLFSAGWHYGTEFWFIYRQILSIPLFKIFNDWHIIRALNILFQQILLLLSYIFMMRQFKLNRKWVLLSCIWLLVPVSHDYFSYIILEVCYNLFFGKMFLSMGIFIYLANINKEKKKGRGVILCLFAFLSLLMGTEGVRALLDFHLPLFITALLLYRYIFEKEKNQCIFLSFFALLFSAAGYMINSKILHRFFNFHNYSPGFDIWAGGTFFSKLSGTLNTILDFFGFSDGLVLSANGILSAFGFIMPVLLFTICFVNLSKQQGSTIVFKYAKLDVDKLQYFMILYFTVNTLFHIVVYQFLNLQLVSRYFFVFLLFSIPVCMIWLINYKKNLKPVIFSAIIIILSIGLYGNGYENFRKALNLNVNASRGAYINYLLENDLNYGFASFWNANVTTELSNGKIEVAGLVPPFYNEDRILYRFQWLSPAKFDNPYYHNGKAFLLLSAQEHIEQQDKGRLNNIIPSFQDENYVILIYPSVAAIQASLL
jgi:hypothetical protein